MPSTPSMIFVEFYVWYHENIKKKKISLCAFAQIYCVMFDDGRAFIEKM